MKPALLAIALFAAAVSAATVASACPAGSATCDPADTESWSAKPNGYVNWGPPNVRAGGVGGDAPLPPSSYVPGGHAPGGGGGSDGSVGPSATPKQPLHSLKWYQKHGGYSGGGGGVGQ